MNEKVNSNLKYT